MRHRNKKSSMMMMLGALAATTPFTNALEIYSTSDALELANILTQGAPGITVTSADIYYGTPGFDEGGEFGGGEFEGSFSTPNSTGTYTNNSGTYGLPSLGGIVLSTGNVSHYGDGSSDNGSQSTSWSNTATSEQNQLLDPITGSGSNHYDVTQLVITFDAGSATNTVSFLSTFGSEEYPDYVGSGFNDGFGLYLNGNNIAGAIPTEGGSALPININHPDMTDIAGTELNGVLAPNGNPVIRFDSDVEAGSTGNTLTIIIGDRSDASLDTTTFISSLGAEGASENIPILPSNGEPNPDGSFDIEFSVANPVDLPGFDVLGLGNTPIWVDPPVAVGYEYEVGTGSPNFAGVWAPSFGAVPDLDGYQLLAFLSDGSTHLVDLLEVSGNFNFLDLDANGIAKFQLLGIDEALMLDPANPLAFPLGLTFTSFGNIDLTITPIAADVSAVPLPAAVYMFGAAMLGLVGFRKKDQKVS